MDLADQPDPAAPASSGTRLVAAIERRGRRRSRCSTQRADAPDMVYAMNLGLVVDRDGRRPARRDVPHALRRAPDGDAAPRSAGSPATASPRRTSAATASAPTSRPATRSRSGTRSSWATARAPRSSASSTSPPTSDVRVRGLRITHPGMYHLDLGFCPLDERRAMVCPAAFDDASARRAARPGARAARAHRGGGADRSAPTRSSIGRTVVMPACPRPGARAARGRGASRSCCVDVGEFHKGGGVGPLPDQPARRGPRPRPAPGGRRRGAAALTRARQSGPALRFAECGPDLVVRSPQVPQLLLPGAFPSCGAAPPG